ncbi:hypothetical protein BPT24_072 [Tenacibaculum phage pT24]|uniref:Uncharacterized protein n=1 Tax=Tenacibaculum phage pT24 TaxID=1880590 RepID=A0A1B4XWN2_9CAUD|nr:hypothetical protein HYP10_gp072 [Tenacibaculum phage pT24]BAV39195.1 hypothetical protein BPT24_072 [Tenacibaculum phage pT24]
MIKVVKEDPELFENFGVNERCTLCSKETQYWHEPTNSPVCQSCAETQTVKYLKCVNSAKKRMEAFIISEKFSFTKSDTANLETFKKSLISKGYDSEEDVDKLTSGTFIYFCYLIYN